MQASNSAHGNPARIDFIKVWCPQKFQPWLEPETAFDDDRLQVNVSQAPPGWAAA